MQRKVLYGTTRTGASFIFNLYHAAEVSRCKRVTRKCYEWLGKLQAPQLERFHLLKKNRGSEGVNRLSQTGLEQLKPCPYAWEYQQDMTGLIYHLLRGPFGQSVAVAQVIDFDISNVVSVGDINLYNGNKVDFLFFYYYYYYYFLLLIYNHEKGMVLLSSVVSTVTNSFFLSR